MLITRYFFLWNFILLVLINIYKYMIFIYPIESNKNKLQNLIKANQSEYRQKLKFDLKFTHFKNDTLFFYCD